ncbi:hypothetical protein UA08_06055 [Talaromyces atroroseus]|uniref:Zn(2)-C6 fungal-type domain-containing protein n=1 Tax=Talaromyces atroroseus TaxID=1441469 RepID=A0A225ABP6_TALAT|nr:hypothetical protein UA08_06055 [Talaromyces atroroseus]OKL58501.1 hypothetical protein UA08_06055 [Talaromyces atroroseus]
MAEPNIARSLAPAPPGFQRKANAEPARQRKNISTACSACKTRKWKCSGTVPCENCVRSNTECIIDESSDNRRRLAVKRKLEELTEDKNLLLRLVETLRYSSNEHVVRLLDLIRNKNSSLDEIKAYLEGYVPDSEIETTPELQEVLDKLEERAQKRSSRRMLDVMWLSHIPVVEVPATPWTTVTDDDSLVSYLISLWLTWSHPFCNWIDRDLFIRDMKSRDTKSKFCSPFLVNSVLAEASFHCDYPEVYEDADAPESKGMHFYKEAKRLLDLEDGRISIPTIQGYATMLSSMALLGKDRLALLSLGQLGRMVAEASAIHLPMQLHADEHKRAEGRAIDNTIWGVMFSTIFMKPIDQKKPLRSQLPHDHKEDIVAWNPYPRQGEKQPAHLGCVFNNLTRLNELNAEGTRRLLKDESRKPMSRPDLETTISSIFPRLQAWYIDLPRCIQDGQSTVPHILVLHMYYHATIMVFFGMLKSSHRYSTRPMTITPREARETCVESALKIAQMIRLYRSKWSIEFISGTAVYWVSIALFVLLEELDDPFSRRAFIDICSATKAFSKQWFLAKSILRMVQVTARKMNISLPPETESSLKDFETSIWQQERSRRRLSSAFPNFTLFFQRVTGIGGALNDPIDMDQFLEKSDDMKLKDSSKG